MPNLSPLGLLTVPTVQGVMLRAALESIPAQYTVDMEKIKQVRYSTGRGMYICKMLAERKESVEEAVKLYHDIMKVIVNG